MTSVSILVPSADNLGNTWSKATYDALHARLIALFGGFSNHDRPVKGGWAGPDGVVYNDESQEYIIAISGLLRDFNKLDTIISYIKDRFQQISVFVRYLGCAEVL